MVIRGSVQWKNEETFDPSLYLIFANPEEDKSLTLLEDVVEFASQYWQNLQYNVIQELFRFWFYAIQKHIQTGVCKMTSNKTIYISLVSTRRSSVNKNIRAQLLPKHQTDFRRFSWLLYIVFFFTCFQMFYYFTLLLWDEPDDCFSWHCYDVHKIRYNTFLIIEHDCKYNVLRKKCVSEWKSIFVFLCYRRYQITMPYYRTQSFVYGWYYCFYSLRNRERYCKGKLMYYSFKSI